MCPTMASAQIRERRALPHSTLFIRRSQQSAGFTNRVSSFPLLSGLSLSAPCSHFLNESLFHHQSSDFLSQEQQFNPNVNSQAPPPPQLVQALQCSLIIGATLHTKETNISQKKQCLNQLLSHNSEDTEYHDSNSTQEKHTFFSLWHFLPSPCPSAPGRAVFIFKLLTQRCEPVVNFL